MWFLRVILNIHRFVDLARRAERSFLAKRPDVCVLVDFPGFHWWLAWRAKRHGIPVVFYCPPQIWAWGSWRVGKLRRLVDHVLSALPFEHEWFSAQGVQSTLVGHPFFDELEAGPAARHAGDERLVLLLPGSRGQEIEGNLLSLLRAAAIVRGRVPGARFAVGALHERHADRIRRLAAGRPEADGVEVVAGQTRQLIGRAAAAIAVSGSVSLELLAARVPAVIVYRVSGLGWVVQSWFRRVRFFTLVNMLAAREPIGPTQPVWWPPAAVPPADPEMVYPEYLAVQDPAEQAAAHVVTWLTDPVARARTCARIDAVARGVVRPGSAARAAEVVIDIAARAAKAAPARRRRAA
jgi:lipid-A-disaccharide synthase